MPPKDAASLAQALGALMEDETRRRAMGAAGLAYAQEQFGIGAMLDAMEEVFRRALNG